MHTNTQVLDGRILRAIIYARVSADSSKTGRSVEEQVRECVAWCETQGWEVGEIVIDNDISASRWSKKDRPGYQRLSGILQPGDVLVCWEASRATRRMGEYTELRDLCADRGVLWCFSGTLQDPRKAGDRLSSGVQAVVSEHEADQIRERALRAQRANAVGGVAHGKVPYGYKALRNPDTGKIEKRVPHETQAPIVREIARRVLTGEPIYAIAADLNKRKVPTARPSKGWTASSMSALIKRPTYAGYRTHKGQVTSEGDWEPLISTEDHERIVALMSDPVRLKHHGVEPVHLLSGIATCGVCGGRIRQTAGRYPKYACVNFCITRRQCHVDELVTELVLKRIEEAQGVEEFADPAQADALAEARRLQSNLNEAVDLFTQGKLTAASLARAEAQLLPQIRDFERIGRQVVAPELVTLLEGGARTEWDKMNATSRRNLVGSLLRITIMKAKPGNRFDPESVVVEWL